MKLQALKIKNETSDLNEYIYGVRGLKNTNLRSNNLKDGLYFKQKLQNMQGSPSNDNPLLNIFENTRILNQQMSSFKSPARAGRMHENVYY